MKNFGFKTCLKIAGAIFCLYLAIHYWPGISAFLGALLSAAAPLAIGFFIAYILNMIMSFYERVLFFTAKKKFALAVKRPVSLLLSFISLGAVISIVVGLILPQLVSCIQLIIGLIPGAIDKGIDLIGKYHLLSDEILATLDAIDWKRRVEQLLSLVTNGVSGVVNLVISTVTGLISGAITAFISIIFAVYLLFSKETLKKQGCRLCRHYLPENFRKNLFYVVGTVNETFRRYIIGQCAEAVILGMLCAVGMMILSLPYAAMISTLIAFTALVPIAGAYIGAGVGAFMILTISPVKALIFLIFIIILQQLEGNLIYPRVVGSSLGLPGIWVLAAITIGGGIAGIGGMLLGVPLTASLYRLVNNHMDKKEAAEKEAAEEKEEIQVEKEA